MDEHRPDTTVSDPGTPTAEASSTLRTWLASSLDGSWPKTLESFRAIRAGPAREATMAIMGYDPFRQLLQLQDRVFRAFDQPNGLARGTVEPEQSVTGTWTPQVDVFEGADAITIKVELPEVNARDVDIQIEGNALTLRGERSLENADKRDSYHRIERSYGPFSRTFTVPSTVDTENTSADCRDGVLRITLPKRAEIKPKQIKVQVAGAPALTEKTKH
jgi:HSP20 family protein